MKKIITILTISISLISWGQNRTTFERKVDSVTHLQKQNHYYHDTLWVMDSSHYYILYDNPDEPILTRKYTVLSRNDNGNVSISTNFPPGGYQQTNSNSWIDTITYFNGSNIRKHKKNIWNSSKGKWQVYEYKEFESPGLVKETFKIKYSNSMDEYNDCWRYLYENSNGRTDVLVTYNYIPENNTWETDTKTLYYYDDDGNDTLQINKVWRYNKWEDSLMERKVFDLDKLINKSSFKYDTTENTWISHYKFIYSYNNEGQVDTTWFMSWNLYYGIWRMNSISAISYDNWGRRNEVFQKRYSYITQQLENYARLLFSYDERKVVETSLKWKMPEGFWQNDQRYTNSFITEDKYDTIQEESWVPNEERWRVKYRNVNEYDHRENLIARKNYYDDYATHELLVQDSTRYFWSAFGVSSVNEPMKKSISVYPNPASSFVNFKFNHLPQNNSKLHIYNIAGLKIDEITLSKEGTIWDCSGIMPGVYIYSVICDGDKSTGKIVVR